MGIVYSLFQLVRRKIITEGPQAEGRAAQVSRIRTVEKGKL